MKQQWQIYDCVQIKHQKVHTKKWKNHNQQKPNYLCAIKVKQIAKIVWEKIFFICFSVDCITSVCPNRKQGQSGLKSNYRKQRL